MTNHVKASAGCLLVGEFVDEAEIPADLVYHRGEVVRPRLAGDFVDVGSNNSGVTEDLSRALLRVAQQETHGPSRVHMVESIVRLQAVEALRDVLQMKQSEDSELRITAVRAMAELFAPTDKELRTLLIRFLEVRKEER